MKFGRNTRLLAAGALLLAVLVAVGVVLWTVVLGPDSGDTPPVVAIGEPVSAELPPEEAVTVTHESGARIYVPAGATAEATTVSVTEVEPPESELELARVFDFSVGNVELLSPVTIHIPFEILTDEDPSEIVALHRNEDIPAWEGYRQRGELLPVTLLFSTLAKR